MFPSGKVVPDWCVVIKETMPQLSVAVGAVQVAVAEVPVVVKLMLAGQPLMTGLTASFWHGLVTTTSKEQVARLPTLSEAV